MTLVTAHDTELAADGVASVARDTLHHEPTADARTDDDSVHHLRTARGATDRLAECIERRSSDVAEHHPDAAQRQSPEAGGGSAAPLLGLGG